MVQKKFVILIIVLVVIAALAIVVSKTNKQGPKNNSSVTDYRADVPLKVQRTEVPDSQAPESFPADIPVEKGAKIVQNYNAKTDEGLFQATRMFESAKSLDENFKLYSDWLNSKGWKLITSLNQDKLKALAASKDKAHLQITMNENLQTKVRTVDITYSETK